MRLTRNRKLVRQIVRIVEWDVNDFKQDVECIRTTRITVDMIARPLSENGVILHFMITCGQKLVSRQNNYSIVLQEAPDLDVLKFLGMLSVFHPHPWRCHQPLIPHESCSSHGQKIIPV